MWAKLKKFDMHSKAMEGVHQQTLLGAILTLITAIVVLLLMFSELSTFFKIDVVSRMVIDKSASSEAVQLVLDITFPFLSCNQILYHQEVTKGTIHFQEHAEITKNIIHVDGGNDGCNLVGSFLVDKVGGNFRFGVIRDPNNPSPVNLTHSINFLSFIPQTEAILDYEALGLPKGFNKADVLVPEEAAVYQYTIQVVPTQYKTLYGKLSFMNQYAVNEKMISNDLMKQGEVIMLVQQKDFIGVVFTYDFNPVMLFLEERRERIIDFISNLFGIVGGVITVLGLIERFLQQSTKVLIGKKD